MNRGSFRKSGAMKRKQNTCAKRKSRIGTTWLLISVPFLLFLISVSGCGNKFFDPTRVGRFRPTPSVNVILDSLGVAEETPLAWEDAEEPKPVDTIIVDSDYTLRAGDILRVAIYELLQGQMTYARDVILTETGRISIPEVGVVAAAGLTETQLEEEIRQILSPSILKNPSVTVTLMQSQQRTFSILGDGIAGAGRYVIPRYGFRLADALALAGGPRQFNVSYIYVARSGDAGRMDDVLDVPMIDQRTGMPGAGQDMLEIIAPTVQRRRTHRGVVVSSAEFSTGRDTGAVAAAGDIGGFGNGTQGWSNVQRAGAGSSAAVGNQRDLGSTGGDDVSVSDILKSLAKRPEQPQRTAPEQSGSQRTTWQNSTASRTGAVGADDILKTLSEKPVHGDVGTDIGSTSTRRPVAVDDILQSLSDQPGGQTGMDERANVDEVLQSFEQPDGQAPLQRRDDVDEVLKSLTVPETGPQPGEQISADDVDLVRPEMGQVGGVSGQSGRIEWIFKDGKWVPVQVGQPQESEPTIKIEPRELLIEPVQERTTPDVGWGPGGGSRLIRIPADKLLAGDPRYNIAIKPGDTIHVPVDIIGEFCIMGNVNGQGYINMTGRPMTLKMAIAAAGGLGPLAWPKRVEVVRRIGKKKEEIVMVDLDKIACGEQPDFFIKPNDLINVGTDTTARWRAVLRNAFRATYGFGFVYDRNFADRDVLGDPLP